MINILLLDREFLFQKAFAKMTEDMEGYRLAGVAENREEALRMMRQFQPQMIFMDTLFEDGKGISFCRVLKNQFPSVQIYLLSGHPDSKSMQQAVSAGVQEVILKPLSRRKLISVLDTCKCTETEQEQINADRLYSAINQKDYKQALDASKKIVQEIFRKEKSEERKEAMETLAAKVFSLVPGMDKEQKNYYLEKYKPTMGTAGKITLGSYWLEQVVTEIFRQLCVMKYMHMNQVYQYIEKNKNEELSLAELSKQAGISGGYLSRIFKKYYRISVVDYIHLRKLHQAKYYMASSEMNISDISFMLGYSEAGYFCKIFKKYEGMTPSAFHRQLRKEYTAA